MPDSRRDVRDRRRRASPSLTVASRAMAARAEPRRAAVPRRGPPSAHRGQPASPSARSGRQRRARPGHDARARPWRAAGLGTRRRRSPAACNLLKLGRRSARARSRAWLTHARRRACLGTALARPRKRCDIAWLCAWSNRHLASQGNRRCKHCFSISQSHLLFLREFVMNLGEITPYPGYKHDTP